LDGQEKVTPGPAPELGEHTREVLLELGRNSEEVDDLLARGAAVQYVDEPEHQKTEEGGG
jgi:hypothetical protein